MGRTSDLDMLIALAYSEGVSRFGDLQLDPRAYASRIRSIIHAHLGRSPVFSAITQFMLTLYGSDLYLAMACSQQAARLAPSLRQDFQAEYSRRAWKIFCATYQEFIGELARLFTGSSQPSTGLTKASLDYFLLPDHSGTSRISFYDGRSSLYTWLRVMVRQAADELLHPTTAAEIRGADAKSSRQVRAGVEQFTAGGAEQIVLATVVAGAFHQLTPKERLLLLWRYKDGLPTERIAELLGVDASRIRPFLERTRLKLAGKVGEILGDTDRISPNDIQRFIRDITDPDRPT